MFKPGQRVKAVGSPAHPKFHGREGVFVRYDIHPFISEYDAVVHFDGEPEELIGPSRALVPLTDPKAEQFIASLAKLGNEPVAPALPVKERVL